MFPKDWTLAAAGALVALLVLAVGAMLGHAAERRSRRGGTLELDTWEARNALLHRTDPTERGKQLFRDREPITTGVDWFEAERFRAGSHVRPFAGVDEPEDAA